MWRSGWRRAAAGWMGAVAAILLVTGGFATREKRLSLSAFDQPFYLGIAHDLLTTGRFTNGFMFDAARPDAGRQSGMRFSPVYPAMLAVAARIDPALRAGMDCVVATEDRPDACSAKAPAMRAVQFAELAGTYLLIWWIGGEVGGGLAMAWLTLGVALLTTSALLRYAGLLMTEMTTLLLSTAAIAAWLRSLRADQPGAWAAMSGALLAATALTRPAFLYLLPVWVLAAAGLAAWQKRDLVRGWVRVWAMAAAGAVVLAPWMLRNRLLLGHAGLTYGYDSHTLVQRIAFDTMDWREYGLAYLCWLPDGTSLGRRYVGAGACDRFGWDDHPNSFYVLGLRHMLDETLRAAGGYAHHLSYLVHTYILPHLLWHAAVTVPLALRGAYVSHWWGFVLLPVCLWMTVVSARRGEHRYLAVALPALFMLAFNAAVAVNQTRYNLLLVPGFALAGALGLRAAASRWQAVRAGGTGTARA